MDTWFGNALVYMQAMWATLQGPELSQGGLQELFADQTPLWCGLGRIKALFIARDRESCK